MKLKNIDIQNFRGFKKLEIQDFQKINLLVGKNNSGKSSVLEAIFLSCGISNPQLAINIDFFRGLIHRYTDDFRFIFYKLDYNNEPCIKTSFDSDEYKRELHIKPSKEILLRESAKQTESRIGNITTDTDNNSQQVNGLIFRFSTKGKHEQKKDFQSSIIINGGNVLEIPKNYKELLRASFFLRKYGELDSTYQYLDQVISAKEKGNIIEILQEIDANITDLSLGAHNVIYCDIGLERLVPINLMGDGINQILGILVHIANLKDGILLIDEIDNGLHYTTLKTLWKAILHASEKYKTQIFATTHSDECVSAYSQAYKEFYDSQVNLRLFRIEKKGQEDIKL
ncbi:MAG: AAA family ATPase [Microscillaceae bacterium]|nr:AAA family ATPase [Microscillaceae bacterium]